MENLRAMSMIEQSAQYNYASLADDYGDSVYRFCRSLAYSKEDAEDLFQETFLKVLEQPDKRKVFDNPQSFLFSTSLFIWKSWKRKYARRKKLAPAESFFETAESGINIEENYMVQEENRVVRQLVQTLPDKYKIPAVLYYTLELSMPEIARILRLPVGTVKSRLFKARKLVKRGLEAVRYEK